MSKQHELVQFSRGSATAIGGGSKNLIINGKFEIDQRHNFAAHTITAGSDFFADRWGFYTDSGATAQYGATSQVVADAPTGFEKSLKWTTTSAGTVPATSEVLFRQKIEGYNISQVDYGSSSAKNLTLSFYVKSSIAGNYGFTAWHTDSGGTNRYNLRSYTINSANTWEYKTILIPADTANVMGKKTNLDGMNLNWDLGEGTTYSGTVTDNWQSTYVNGLTGGVKIADNNGATWQITGCQLEVNDSSTDFDHEDYGTTLAKCERFFQTYSKRNWQGTNEHAANYYMYCDGVFRQKMRAAPTATFVGTITIGRPQVGVTQRPNEISGLSSQGFLGFKWPTSGTYGGQLGTHGDTYYRMYVGDGPTNRLDFDAEL